MTFFQIKIFDDLREELESSEEKWTECHNLARDPQEIFDNRKMVFDQEQLNKKTNEKKSTGFFGGLFKKEEAPATYGRKKNTEDLAVFKGQLEADVEAFQDLPELKGLYLFGDPGQNFYHHIQAIFTDFDKLGCGKTFMMDLFYTHTDIKHKRRVHYNEFMLNIHQMNHSYYEKKYVDSLFQTGSEIATSTRLLCLDEFQVTDIGDAMVMRRLFNIMWKYRLILVVNFDQPFQRFLDLF